MHGRRGQVRMQATKTPTNRRQNHLGEEHLVGPVHCGGATEEEDRRRRDGGDGGHCRWLGVRIDVQNEVAGGRRFASLDDDAPGGWIHIHRLPDAHKGSTCQRDVEVDYDDARVQVEAKQVHFRAGIVVFKPASGR